MLSRKFHYSALQENGQTLTGTLDGENKNAVKRHLLQQGLIPQKIWTEFDIEGLTWNESKNFEKIMSSLTNLLDSGLSITASLDYLITHSSKKVKGKSQELKKDLEDGKKFSQSVQKNFPSIDTFYILLLESAEKTGDLLSTLQNISFMIQKNNEFKNNAVAALIYPLFLLIIIGFVIAFIMSFSLPEIIAQLDEEASLPLPTTILIAVYNLQEYILPFLFISIVGVFLIKYLQRINSLKKIFDWILIKLPIISHIIFFFIQRSFLQIIAYGLKGGISLEESLKLTNQISRNVYIQIYLQNTEDDINNGLRFADAISALPFLTQEQKFIINIGDESANLSTTFDNLYQKNEKMNERNLKLFNKMIEPFIIILLGLVVLILALGIILPSLELSQGINLV